MYAIGLLLLVCLFLFSLSTLTRSAYQRCYYPLFGRRQNEWVGNLTALAVVAFVVAVLYGITGGSLAFFLKGRAPTGPDLRVGAVLGGLVFVAARSWALMQGHSFAKAVFYMCTLMLAAAIALVAVKSDGVQSFIDGLRGREAELGALVAVYAGVAFASVALSEVIPMARERCLGPRGPIVSYGFIREQRESFEAYERVHGEVAGLELIRHEISVAALKAKAENRELPIDWLTCNGAARVVTAIATAGIDVDLRVIAHDDDDTRRSLSLLSFGELKYTPLDGGLRVLLVDRQVAVVGLGLGSKRHDAFPDYVVRIVDPMRVAHYRCLFDKAWGGLSGV